MPADDPPTDPRRDSDAERGGATTSSDADEATARSEGGGPDGRRPGHAGFDDRILGLLTWLLDTETRVRIYLHLRRNPWSTSDEVADGTELYPSTVREALAALHEEGVLERRKRASDGAGNNPFEYEAMAPPELVSSAVDEVQRGLNTVFHLDAHLGVPGAGDAAGSPVSISVADGGDDGDADDSDAAVAGDEAAPDGGDAGRADDRG